MSLYAWINLFSIAIPLVFSFHPSIRFRTQWKWLIPAIVISMAPYIIWDIYFTHQGFWGFNQNYLIGVFYLGLPLEEWLFFFCIPYACVFTHVALLTIRNDLILSQKTTNIITILLLVTFLVIAIFHYDLAYTFTDVVFASILLILVYLSDKQLLRSYYITFLFMLIPFFFVNGILTGTGIANEVVWYNNDENMGIRILTIPVEDIIYAFSLILLNLFLFSVLKRLEIAN